MASILRKKIVAVTGANGMLGNAFCAFLEKDNVVLALHRDEICYAPCMQDFSVELSDRRRVKEVLSQIQPDIMVHCAGSIDVDRCEQNPEFAYESNVLATKNVLAGCEDRTKVVYISTDQVYGERDNRIETSGDLNPINVYGETKLNGEQAVLEHRSDSIVARTNVFGWNVKPGRVSSAEKIFHALKGGSHIALFNDYEFSPIFSQSVVSAIVALCMMKFSGIINICSPVSCSKYEFGMEMARLAGYRLNLINRESLDSHGFLAKRPGNLALPVKKCEELGVTLPNYIESLQQFLSARCTVEGDH